MTKPTERDQELREHGTVHVATGVRCVRAGAPIESVETRAGAVRLIGNGTGAEIVEGRLGAGERISLLPDDGLGGAASESYYILEGSLRLEDAERSLSFAVGDCITVEGMEVPVALTALSDVRFLYVSTRPFFHEISGVLKDLMHLAEEVELVDGYTADHCLRLQRLAYATGKVLGLEGADLVALDHGAYLHDIGKVKVPATVLQKPGALTEDEWAIIRRHPITGREMLERTSLRYAASIVEQHHERIDGSGYPYGLAGEDVLVGASIVGVADTYDAMTSDRVYRPALGHEAALQEIDDLAGKTFPVEVVRAFKSALEELREDER